MALLDADFGAEMNGKSNINLILENAVWLPMFNAISEKGLGILTWDKKQQIQWKIVCKMGWS